MVGHLISVQLVLLELHHHLLGRDVDSLVLDAVYVECVGLALHFVEDF